LFFLGLEFQYALASASLWGVGRDAAYVVKQLNKRPSRHVTQWQSVAAGA